MATIETLMRRATDLHRSGDLDGAAKCYRQAIARAPRLADAHHLLGLTQHQSGRNDEAMRSIGKAIAINPVVAAFHGNLGLVRQADGDLVGAIRSFQEALNLDPHYHPARLNLATALAARNQLDDALAHYHRLLNDAGSTPALEARLAETLRRLGRLEEAAVHYDRALAGQPDDAELHAALAGTYQLLGDDDAALRSYEAALRLRPDLTAARLNMAALLRDAGRPREALAAYVQLRHEAPELLDAIAGEAITYEHMGEPQHAWQVLEPYLRHHGTHPSIALARAGLAGQFEPIEVVQEVLAGLAVREDLPRIQRQRIVFARADLLDKLTLYDDALAAYGVANQLTRSVFDGPAHALRCAAIRAAYPPGTIPGVTGCTSERPVFIVGMPRSGTSLVEEILASHRDIFGAGELSALPNLTVSQPLAHAYPEHIDTLSPQSLTEIGGIYLSQLAKHHQTAQRVTDKMPSNFLHLGLIRQLFPHARIIHVMRDPMDTCLSCYRQNFGERLAYTTNYADLAAFYGQYLEMMAHWRSVVRDGYMELQYEDLIENQEYWSRELIKFVGLDWDPACLAFHDNRRYVRTASYQQVRQPIYRHSIGRWHKYGPAIEPLRQALEAVGANIRR